MSAQSFPDLEKHVNILEWLTPKDCVRNLDFGETIPSHMDAGFDLLGKLDREWIWVLESAGEIKGVLVASNFHGLAFLWRLKVLPGVDNFGALKLLKRFRRDCKKRGVKGYITLADLSTDTGRRLKAIVERCGGKDYGTISILSSPLEKERHD